MPPLLRLIPSDPPYSNGFPPKSGDSKPGNGRHLSSTVLVVEDEILIRMPVADHLRRDGYRVLEASNAEEAQAVFRAGEPIEVIFSDVQMPGPMDGLALAHWIREKYPDVAIILTSGGMEMAETIIGSNKKILFLQKPYSYEILMMFLKNLIR